MIKILFVCHGNICRSPMAEFVLCDMVKKAGLENEILVASAATSREEIGNPVHYGTQAKMQQMGIPMTPHRAIQLTKRDYEEYDYIIGMEHWNLRNIGRICGRDTEQKVHLLLDFSDRPRDISDPWYTGDFDTTYRDVVEGCEGLLKFLIKEYHLQ
ncbi:MAG: low molecular weight protein-tyrosine-phosphatase [Lachnospiraceae bacterium]|nr:low molecular weight protein-tyrosine-phosphatase [Lachnospiraceae bacterium]